VASTLLLVERHAVELQAAKLPTGCLHGVAPALRAAALELARTSANAERF